MNGKKSRNRKNSMRIFLGGRCPKIKRVSEKSNQTIQQTFDTRMDDQIRIIKHYLKIKVRSMTTSTGVLNVCLNSLECFRGYSSSFGTSSVRKMFHRAPPIFSFLFCSYSLVEALRIYTPSRISCSLCFFFNSLTAVC